MPTTIAGSSATSEPYGYQQSTTQTGIMGKDDFLKLLVMQLRFQDPLNPMEGTEFASQLAQFSSVEQLGNIKEQLAQSLQANAVMAQSMNNALATTIIGQDVIAAASAFSYSGQSGLSLGYTLGQEATSVTISIVDAYGNIVRTVTSTNGSEGDNDFTWDGMTDNGTPAGHGTYTINVEAKDANGAALENVPFVRGTVESVRFTTNGTVFVINGVEVPLADIREIRKD